MARRKKAKSNVASDNHLLLNDVSPLTDAQSLFWEQYATNKHQLMLGYPGTGKTFLAMFKAFEEILQGDYKRIVIVRSGVPTRDIGFLPGTEQEKAAVYELPYKKVCADLFGRDDSYEVLKKHDGIRFVLTSFVRGITIENSIVIVDEMQNMTAHEADSVLTRVGRNCKIIFCGDVLQRDFTKNTEKNIEKFLKVLERMGTQFSITHFGLDDIVRSGLVSDYIKTKHLLYKDGY
jgi:phosphate starvation-inducible PhoH-like protein